MCDNYNRCRMLAISLKYSFLQERVPKLSTTSNILTERLHYIKLDYESVYVHKIIKIAFMYLHKINQRWARSLN